MPDLKLYYRAVAKNGIVFGTERGKKINGIELKA